MVPTYLKVRRNTSLLRHLDDPIGASLLLALAIAMASMALTLVWGAPVPVVHDEFVYVFQAQTFAAGRLTNPPHPMADFFEAFHVLQHPTYMGKFPPLWSAILAPGVLIGAPGLGIWLANIFYGWALLYLARALVRMRWAFCLALWGSFHFVLLSYWGSSYWGGAANALGGILTLAGVLHQRRTLRLRAAAVVGLGLALSILSRPFEGAMFSLPIGVFYLWKLWKLRGRRLRPGRYWGAFLLPSAGVFAAVAFQAVYNQAVTGSPTLHPHVLYQETYFPDFAHFTWETPGPPPAHRPDTFDRYVPTAVLAPYTSFQAAWRGYGRRFLSWFEFYTPAPVLFAAAFILLSRRSWREGITLLILAELGIRLLFSFILTVIEFTHYTAAWSAVSVVVLAQGLRIARVGLRAGHARRWLGPFRVWPALLMAGPLITFSILEAGKLNYRFSISCSMVPALPFHFIKERDETEIQLSRQSVSRDLLILVHYTEEATPHAEWVYNGPDIDTQTVIWARDLGEERNQEILDYYPDRSVWRMTIGGLLETPKFERLRPVPRSPDESPAAASE